jgi:tetratricopeptide (TPR) repeat protein
MTQSGHLAGQGRCSYLSRCSSNSKHTDEAIADCDKAIELDPKDTFNSRGMAYAEKGQYDRAITDLDQALKLDPECALATESRAKIIAKKMN